MLSTTVSSDTARANNHNRCLPLHREPSPLDPSPGRAIADDHLCDLTTWRFASFEAGIVRRGHHRHSVRSCTTIHANAQSKPPRSTTHPRVPPRNPLESTFFSRTSNEAGVNTDGNEYCGCRGSSGTRMSTGPQRSGTSATRCCLGSTSTTCGRKAET